jgi:hypothetical protein
MIIMGDEGSRYSIYGESPDVSETTEIHELERVKSDAVEKLEKIGLSFPIGSRRDFLNAVRTDKPTYCSYRGKRISLKELIAYLSDEDFPLNSLAEAATMLAAACPIHASSAEDAPLSEF